MTIVLAWMAYCAVVAAVLSLGAAAWERAARWSGRPARWGWLLALAGSVTVPWLLRLMPERGWAGSLPAAMPMLRLDPLTPSAGAAVNGWSVQGAALALWAAASALVLAYIVVMLVQLTRARRQWRATELDGGPVLVAAAMGPAALGVRRSAIVVPAWVLELDAELRSLLVRHERAHIEAGDPRLLLSGIVLLAAMPWNPVVWLQLLRLRNAIELDCDARVLSTGADPERYGSLLLEVGRRRSSHTLVMATFAEPRAFLEQRIRRIAQWPLEQRRGRAAVFTTAALVMFAAALSCDPVRVANPTDGAPAVPAIDGRTLNAATDSPTAMPQFTPMTRRPELLNRDEVETVLVESYPPLLREAGIEGRPTVFFFIDTLGVVQRMQISRSSGYPALDAAALSVAGAMRFSSAYNRQQKVAVWVEIPIVFSRQDADSDRADHDMPILRERIDPGAQAPEPERTPPLGDVRREPVFTPMTQRPELQNRDEVRNVLRRSYPPLLRDAGIGGSPILSLFIDETGVVRETRIARSSGYPALDQAALAVAKAMRFTPAQNRGRDVPVWFEIPIVFTAS